MTRISVGRTASGVLLALRQPSEQRGEPARRAMIEFLSVREARAVGMLLMATCGLDASDADDAEMDVRLTLEVR